MLKFDFEYTPTEEESRKAKEFMQMQEESLKRVQEEGAFSSWLPEDDYDPVLDYLPDTKKTKPNIEIPRNEDGSVDISKLPSFEEVEESYFEIDEEWNKRYLGEDK